MSRFSQATPFASDGIRPRRNLWRGPVDRTGAVLGAQLPPGGEKCLNSTGHGNGVEPVRHEAIQERRIRQTREWSARLMGSPTRIGGFELMAVAELHARYRGLSPRVETLASWEQVGNPRSELAEWVRPRLGEAQRRWRETHISWRPPYHRTARESGDPDLLSFRSKKERGLRPNPKGARPEALQTTCVHRRGTSGRLEFLREHRIQGICSSTPSQGYLGGSCWQSPTSPVATRYQRPRGLPDLQKSSAEASESALQCLRQCPALVRIFVPYRAPPDGCRPLFRARSSSGRSIPRHNRSARS